MKNTSKMTKGIFTILLGVAVAVFASHTFAQSGTWVTKTPMPTARWYPTAQAIDGKLYVVGGIVSGVAVNNFEVYDPVTDTWTIKANTPPTPVGGSASGVINGKLYVAGESSDVSELNTLYVYDPATDTWTTKAPLPLALAQFQGGVINGKFYVAGGNQTSQSTGNTLFVYDPATDTWTQKASLPTPRTGLGEGVVNSQLFAVGGINGCCTPLTTVEAYDPATDTWTGKASLPELRYEPGVVGINGLLFVVGGGTSTTSMNTTFAYDPGTDTWTTLDPMPTDRTGPAVAAINGQLYVVGGLVNSGAVSNLVVSTLEVFSPFNTPVSSNVVVQPVDATTGTTPVTLTFSSVTQDGMTSLTTSSSGPPPPTGFSLGNPSTYYDLTTTAVVTSPIEVCIAYSGTCPAALFHYVNGTLGGCAPGTGILNPPMAGDCTDPSQTICNQAPGDRICGTVTSLSPFAIGVQELSICTSGSTSIASNFNGTPIAGGNFIWSNAVVKVSGLNSKQAVVQFTNGKITFTDKNGTPYNLTMPNNVITFSSSATQATTSFNGTQWVTTVPLNYDGNVSIGGMAFQVPSGGLSGGINPVKISGNFTSNISGLSINWQWAAAVYTKFSTDLNALGVKPIDGSQMNPYNNSDHAGTPENFKNYVTGGARGGGGSNYTGSYSGTGHCP